MDIHAIDDDRRDVHDEFRSIKECTVAVKKMKNNKSPEFDGLPIEFYKLTNQTFHQFHDLDTKLDLHRL